MGQRQRGESRKSTSTTEFRRTLRPVSRPMASLLLRSCQTLSGVETFSSHLMHETRNSTSAIECGSRLCALHSFAKTIIGKNSSHGKFLCDMDWFMGAQATIHDLGAVRGKQLARTGMLVMYGHKQSICLSLFPRQSVLS